MRGWLRRETAGCWGMDRAELLWELGATARSRVSVSGRDGLHTIPEGRVVVRSKSRWQAGDRSRDGVARDRTHHLTFREAAAMAVLHKATCEAEALLSLPESVYVRRGQSARASRSTWRTSQLVKHVSNFSTEGQ